MTGSNVVGVVSGVIVGLTAGMLWGWVLHPDTPQAVERRIVYTGPAAQLADTTYTRIGFTPYGDVMFQRSIETYFLKIKTRRYFAEDEAIWIYTVYGDKRTTIDTICYEPVKCGE
jgi:hypothetical protein